MRRIFISYRRDDSQLSCDRIYSFLGPIFGVQQVFRDINAIPGGADFRTAIEQNLSTCSVMLVVIGPQWASITGASGHRRLDEPNDLVRIEVETALRRGIPLVPLLVQGAAPPPAASLPPTIQQLSYQNMRVVRPDPDFANDMQVVMQDVAQYVPFALQGGRVHAMTSTVRRLVGVVVSLVSFVLFIAALSTWVNLPIITGLVRHFLNR